MNGTFTVKFTVGKGSTFSIILKDVDILEENEEKVNNYENVKIIFENSKILHVEDVEYNRDLMAIYFEGKNIYLKNAESGKMALEILENYTPDLIIMDIQMPGINGYETTKIIRANPKLKHIPVIALTANATKNEIEKYSPIFNNYLTKPTDENDLMKIISKYLKHKKEKLEDIEIEEEKDFIEECKKEKFSDEFINIVKTKIEPLYYKEIANILAIDEIKNFCKELKKVTTKFHIISIEKYSNSLDEAMSHFDIDKVTQLRDIFPEIIKIIYK